MRVVQRQQVLEAVIQFVGAVARAQDHGHEWRVFQEGRAFDTALRGRGIRQPIGRQRAHAGQVIRVQMGVDLRAECVPDGARVIGGAQASRGKRQVEDAQRRAVQAHHHLRRLVRLALERGAHRDGPQGGAQLGFQHHDRLEGGPLLDHLIDVLNHGRQVVRIGSRRFRNHGKYSPTINGQTVG